MGKIEKKSFLRRIFNLLIIIGILFITYKVFNGFQELSKIEKLKNTKELNRIDSTILNDYLLKNGKVIQILQGKLQNSFIELNLENKFNVYVYKLGSLQNKELNNLVHLENTSLARSIDINYHVVETNNFKLSYKDGIETSSIKDLILTHSNETMNIWQNSDTAFVLNGFSNIFSIRYGENLPVEIHFEKHLLSDVPISLILRNRKSELIFYLITSTGKLYDIPDSFIYKVIK